MKKTTHKQEKEDLTLNTKLKIRTDGFSVFCIIVGTLIIISGIIMLFTHTVKNLEVENILINLALFAIGMSWFEYPFTGKMKRW